MSAKYVFPKALKELRFHFSQTGETSVAIKTFITKHYPALKKNNPTIPILIREARDVRPTVYARFDHGKEFKVHVDQGSQLEIEKLVRALIEKSI